MSFPEHVDVVGVVFAKFEGLGYKIYLPYFIFVSICFDFFVVLSGKQVLDRLSTLYFLHLRFCDRLELIVSWMEGWRLCL